MRIAFITPEFVTESYYSGGLANYLYRVSKALISFGHQVHVITCSTEAQMDFEYEGIWVHRVPIDRPGFLYRIVRRKIPQTALWLGFSLRAYRKLKSLHKEQPFDILQFPNSRACGLFTALCLPVPYAVRISCYRPVWNEMAGVDRNLDVRIVERLEQLQFRLSRNIYAPSQSLKEMLDREIGITRTQVIRPPVYLETANWDQSVYREFLAEKDYLLFFGRFQLHKGFHILAQALPHVLATHPSLHAVFVGLDTSTKIALSMKEYAYSLCAKDANRLVFIDQTRHAQLYPIIDRARFVVLPSLVENLPNACLEAMALGKVVIGTKGTSFEEVIEDERTGFLVSPGRVEELAAKICEVWSRNDLKQIGKAAKEKVSEFAPEYMVRTLVDYYRGIIGD